MRGVSLSIRDFNMIHIATACGVGMGSSLVLRMYTEDVLKELGVEANVEAMDVSQAKGAKVDLVLTSPALVEVVSGGMAIVKGVSNYIDKSLIRAALIEYFEENGIPYNK
jgi:PTS system ascorbate-specific IIB component